MNQLRLNKSQTDIREGAVDVSKNGFEGWEKEKEFEYSFNGSHRTNNGIYIISANGVGKSQKVSEMKEIILNFIKSIVIVD